MTDTKFNCKHCGQSLEAPEDMAGDLIDCPACSQVIEVPFRRAPPRSFAPRGSTPTPSVPSHAPSSHSTQDLDRAIARQKSYIGPAVLTFFVYWLFYLPGLIVNLLYLSDANRTARIAEEQPSGYGCLVVLLILGLIPLAIGALLLFGALGMM